MANEKSNYFFKEKSWEPMVECDGANLIYCVPIANGHNDKSFRFSISQEEFEVLKHDVERRYFLYVLLHSIYQPRPASKDLQVDRHIRQVLFGSIPEVERLLSLHDAKSNGAVSNLVRIYMGGDYQLMRAGHWFLE